MLGHFARAGVHNPAPRFGLGMPPLPRPQGKPQPPQEPRAAPSVLQQPPPASLLSSRLRLLPPICTLPRKSPRFNAFSQQNKEDPHPPPHEAGQGENAEPHQQSEQPPKIEVETMTNVKYQGQVESTLWSTMSLARLWKIRKTPIPNVTK